MDRGQGGDSAAVIGRAVGMEPLGAELRRWRESAGLSLAELAKRVNYSRGYLSKVETGRARVTARLADLYDRALETDGVLGRLARVTAPRPPSDQVDPQIAVAGMVVHQPDDGIAFVLALDRAHGGLRGVARTPLQGIPRRDAANRIVDESGLYAARERVLVSCGVEQLAAAEAAFLRLIGIRDAVRSGAELESPSYHDAYHPFAEALWKLRMALRAAAGQSPVSPTAVGRRDWSDRERCTCGVRVPIARTG